MNNVTSNEIANNLNSMSTRTADNALGDKYKSARIKLSQKKYNIGNTSGNNANAALDGTTSNESLGGTHFAKKFRLTSHLKSLVELLINEVYRKKG
eukprot:CAMPEP_0176352900 /NCGR_PEP_ID=MMETSP0126-20121128/11402_1 /TAXON_ID=141414 ORGANISM="Strombidinopsis acuminatum, Strain SPMC142" /NCGR_SAMPLE_ID=MMETSP0126 /ASSEMBLY_ACC=CAM_ASM_000229 /LENGTH=95 /DNA_ID=CAMNT_0017704303 /DNA_START=184 /DNA_END=471 /DNA_ORIENTATION=-